MAPPARGRSNTPSRLSLAARLGQGLKALVKHGDGDASPLRRRSGSTSSTSNFSEKLPKPESIASNLSEHGTSPNRGVHRESPLHPKEEPVSPKLTRSAAKRQPRKTAATSFSFASPFFEGRYLSRLRVISTSHRRYRRACGLR